MKKRLRKKKQMEVQNAWDVVCDFLDKNNDNKSHCFYVDSSGYGGRINIHTASSSDKPVLISTKSYRKV